LLLAPALAQAGTVTADAVIDLNTVITGHQWTGSYMPLVAPVDVQEGDTVNINITFAPGQALTWNSSGYFDPWLLERYNSFHLSNVSASFTNLTQGTQLDPSQFSSGLNGCCIALGPNNSLGADNVLRTFTGATVSFVVDLFDGDKTSNYGYLGYSYPTETLFSGDVAISSVAATPIPAAFPLFASAIGVLGFVGWRRKRSMSSLG
jgi:hypothetical protein